MARTTRSRIYELCAWKGGRAALVDGRQGGEHLGDGGRGAAEDLEFGVFAELELGGAVGLIEVARGEQEGGALKLAQRQHVLRAVARAIECHLDKGGDARGQL